MRNPKCALWAATLLVVSGCASAPQFRYFTLDMRPSGKIPPTFQLEPVKIDVAEALTKPEIMIRTSPTQITYYALDRWASGIEQQLSEKLATEFAAAPADAPAIRMTAKLLAFEQVDTAAGAEARVKMEVSAIVVNGKPDAFTHKIYERTVPAGASTAAAVVESLSRVVEEIALEITQEPALQPN